MPKNRIDICVLGSHEQGYPRNTLVQKWMRAAGFGVHAAHSLRPFPLRHFDLALQYLRLAPKVDAIWITEGGHRLVPLIKLLAVLTGKRVIFDPFLSRYNTRVEDRRWHKPGSLQAWICKWQDWSSCHAADYLVFDTWENKEYFYSHYGLKKPFAVFEIGADESAFLPVPPSGRPKPVCEVLFYGTYIPLQGIDTILDAAGILKSDASIRFSLLGNGQVYESVRAAAAAKDLSSMRFEKLEPLELRARAPRAAAEADVCLGIFGEALKAARAVPNKVVQCAATAKPIISRSSPAMERYFAHGRDVLFVPPADGKALAEAVQRLCRDPELRARLGKGARETYEKHFSDAVQTEKMSRLMGGILRRTD